MVEWEWVESRKSNNLSRMARTGASQVVLVVKNPPASAGDLKRHSFDPWVRKLSWSRKWQPNLVFLPGKFPEHRSLVVYSP